MTERRLPFVALVAGVACCAATAVAAVVVGGVALASLGRFGIAGVAAAGIGAVVDAPGTALSYWLFGWITLTLGWLGISFLVATALATPGCEMRALPHLRTKLGREQRYFAACPGPLQPLDEWEARTTGRARPHTPA